MRALPSQQRWVLFSLAVVFSAATILYAGIWMYCIRWERRAQLGLAAWSYDYEAAAKRGYLRVQQVAAGTGAAQAGLRAGDLILAINGRPLDTPNPFFDEVGNGRPGDSVAVTIERPGRAGPLELRVVLQPVARNAADEPWTRTFAEKLLVNYPLLFLVVGLPVLFLRLEDRNAWLLALLFAGLIAMAPLVVLEPRIPRALRGYAVAYKIVFGGLSAALFCYFFAVFPVPSPVDRRLPWIKTAFLGAAAAVSVPLGAWGFSAESFLPLVRFGHGLPSWVGYAITGYFFGGFVLGLTSLVGNAFAAPAGEARRKTRVMIWGTVVGMTPAILLYAAAVSKKQEPYQFPFWVWAPCVIAMFLIPLSFGYAVLKHRVMEIPVLLKRSARYVLVQRGFIVLLFIVAACAIVLFTKIFSRLVEAESNIGMAASAVFGIVMVWAAAPLVRRGTERIDRAFFRSAYDARVVLQDLAEKARMVSDRHQLGALLERHILEALHPKSLASYLEAEDGRLSAEFGRVPPQLLSLDPAMPLLRELVRRGRSWEPPPAELRIPPSDLAAALGPLPPHRVQWFSLAPPIAADLSAFAPLAPECLVPILGRNSGLIGLLVLGQRLSEEPYSSEDKHLLDSVASQAGVTLENIGLAEKMAERTEAERRAAIEMDIARRVQARLFPQNLPPLETIEYVGGCVQARQVGGDYYDFLDMGPGVLGIVLADISGKGMSGALLMANLQANLRSQYAVALDDLPRLLQSVNRLFYENTTEESYATMFFGVYDDSARKLRYANCGHIAPLILRTDGSVLRLTSTTTVLGLFLKWECPIEEEELYPGDLLVICTDGVSEARNPHGEEYGEVRLVELIRENRALPVNELQAVIQASVQEFSGGTLADDITLIVALCR